MESSKEGIRKVEILRTKIHISTPVGNIRQEYYVKWVNSQYLVMNKPAKRLKQKLYAEFIVGK
jgi:hypothetical protein